VEERPESSRLRRASLTEDMPGALKGTVMMLFPFSRKHNKVQNDEMALLILTGYQEQTTIREGMVSQRWNSLIREGKSLISTASSFLKKYLDWPHDMLI
jgi:hypothetical protein